MASHLELGKKGELLARQYLLSDHYSILYTNWRCGRREIDIIASHAGCFIFVEVKTLASDRFGWPEKKVNYVKQRVIKSAAEVFLRRMPQPPVDIRFDVIAITFLPDGSYDLVHFKDAF